MKYAKFFSFIVFLAIAAYGAIGFYFLPQANFEGNLTRMGKIPESLFGWTKEQPAIDPTSLISSSWEDADVLVIGDSFSMPHLWQSQLTRRGLKVHTETWESMRNICEDFGDWLRNKNFKGRYVAIEVIEHNLEDRLDRSVHCKNMEYHAIAEPVVSPPPRLVPRNAVSYNGKLSVGIETELNVVKYLRLRAQPNFNSWDMPNGVRMNRIRNGCELFSHPSCNDVLFFADDHVEDFDDSTLERMATINNRLGSLIPLWIVVPDKSTAYLHTDKRFWDKAEARFHAPNVLKTLRGAIQGKTIDLYRANDTHLSTIGYLILGDAIFQSMQQAQQGK